MQEPGFAERGLTDPAVISFPLPSRPFRAPARMQADAGPVAASSWTASWQKRALDIVVSSVALAVLALPMALIAAAVRLSSPGPAFFALPGLHPRYASVTL